MTDKELKQLKQELKQLKQLKQEIEEGEKQLRQAFEKPHFEKLEPWQNFANKSLKARCIRKYRTIFH